MFINGLQMGQKKNSNKPGNKTGKRKKSSDNGNSNSKTPRNGASPNDVNNSFSISDTIRKANSVLFNESEIIWTNLYLHHQ